MPSRRNPSLTPQEQFATNLRRLREEAGLTQQELADLSGPIHRTEVSLLERAGREPRLSTIVALARALKVSVGELLDHVK